VALEPGGDDKAPAADPDPRIVVVQRDQRARGGGTRVLHQQRGVGALDRPAVRGAGGRVGDELEVERAVGEHRGLEEANELGVGHFVAVDAERRERDGVNGALVGASAGAPEGVDTARNVSHRRLAARRRALGGAGGRRGEERDHQGEEERAVVHVVPLPPA
jgi:hypothetical protein